MFATDWTQAGLPEKTISRNNQKLSVPPVSRKVGRRDCLVVSMSLLQPLESSSAPAPAPAPTHPPTRPHPSPPPPPAVLCFARLLFGCVVDKKLVEVEVIRQYVAADRITSDGEAIVRRGVLALWCHLPDRRGGGIRLQG